MIELPNRTSITTTLLDHMRGGAAWLGYRRKLRSHLVGTLPPRLLHVLAELPLPLSDTIESAERAGQPTHWLRGADVVALCERSRMPLALVGMPGSGRSIVLAQIAWHWAQGNTGIPPLLLDLAHDDQSHTSPYQLVCAALARAGEVMSPVSGLIETRRPWLLLVAGWEELSLPRQAEWHDFLLSLPRIWPDAQLVLELPDEGLRQHFWSNSMPLVMRPPDDELLERMLTVLLPRANCAPLLAALAPHGPLASLRERTLDLLLLAWVYQEQGVPTGRAALWSWAIAHNRIQPTKFGGTWLQDHQIMRRYRQARELASNTRRLTVLNSLPDNERREVVLFVAELLPDLAPLCAALWSEPSPDLDRLKLLGQALLTWWEPQRALKYGPGTAVWVLRIAGALAEQNEQPWVDPLIDRLQPLLGAAIAAPTEAVQQEIVGVITRLPVRYQEQLLLETIDQTAFSPEVRWAAADQLLRGEPSRAFLMYLSEQPAPDASSRAIRCYLLVLSGSKGMAALDHPAAHDWAAALLADPHAGVLRQNWVEQTVRAVKDAPESMPAIAALFNTAPSPTAPVADEAAESTQEQPPDRCAEVNDSSDQTPSEQPALAPLPHEKAVGEEEHQHGKTVEHEPDQPAQHPAIQLTLREHAITLLDNDASAQQRRAALTAIGGYPTHEASLVLARCSLLPFLPLWVRLRAVTLLGARRGAPTLLRKLLRAPAAHDLVRAQAARRLADTLQHTPPPDELIESALDGEFPLTRREAVRALGRLRANPTTIDILITLVAGHLDDIDLLEAAMVALGHHGRSGAIPWLASWLGARALTRLRAGWSKQAARLTPPLLESWPHAQLSASRRQFLATTFASCATPADQPTTLDELLNHLAERLSATAAGAIALIGDPAACVSLVQAAQNAPPSMAPPLLKALASLDATGEAMVMLLDTPQLDGQTRWLVVQHLAPDLVARSSDQLLAATADDPFTRGALATALARCPVADALPPLRLLAETPNEHPYVREQALFAIGQIGGEEAEALLLACITDTTIALSLRVAAANALPESTSAETRQRLRALLRANRLELPLLVGILNALGTAHDDNALRLLLGFCQHEQPEVALAALNALERIGDSAACPVLAHVAQSPDSDPTVRTRAAGVALRLCGEQYLPLLLPALDEGSLPLQMQALELLFTAQPDSPLLSTLVKDQARAVPLRQRAIEALAGLHEPAASRSDASANPGRQQRETLCALLADPHENPAIRLLAADVLAAAAQGTTDQEDGNAAEELLAIFAPLASDPELPDNLRLRCIAGLAALGPIAAETLSRLAADQQQSEALRSWATNYLYAAEQVK